MPGPERFASRRLAVALVAAVLLVCPALAWRWLTPLVLAPCPPERARAIAAQAARSAGDWRGPQTLSCAPDGPALRGGAALLAGQRIALNGASARELAAVPGISAGLAELVVAERERLGRFHELAELQRVSGIGPRRRRALEAFVEIRPTPPPDPAGSASPRSQPAAAADQPVDKVSSSH